MAKARARISTKLPQKLSDLNSRFDKAMDEYLKILPLRAKLLREYNRICEQRFVEIDWLEKNQKTKFDIIAARNVVMEAAGRKSGYYEVADAWNRMDYILNKLCKQIVKIKPESYKDLAIQVKAFSYLAYDYTYGVSNAEDEKVNFMLRFANFAGVKIHVHTYD